MATSRRGWVLVTLILVVALALAVGNLLCHARTVRELTGSGAGEPLFRVLQMLYRAQPAVLSYLTIAPLTAGVILALLVGRQRGSGAMPGPPSETHPGLRPSPGGEALRLLALLQREGRLIDFLEEDIDGYSDAQVGTAVRAIHSGCRKALHERMTIERIFTQEDGSEIAVEVGFDPAHVRLTGNVRGQPPFRGTLQHGGWRASHVKLPAPSALDPTILAAAEVEVP